MNPINEIREKLKKYPHLNVEEENSSITVKAESNNGFDVIFVEDEGEYTVYFDGWHEHFSKTNSEDALKCFAFGLSDSCRIKVYSRKGKAYKWILESNENGKWLSYSTTGLFCFNFIRKPEIRYLQNKLINGKDS